MSWWTVNLNNMNSGLKSGGVTSTPKDFRTAFYQAPKTKDAYAQYDRALEHGFAGEQYRYGKPAGGLLNFEC